MLGASLCWSTGGLFVRSVSIPNSWEIAFWRSLSMGVFLLVWLSFRYAGNVRRAVVAIGPGGFLAGLCMAASFLGFILAVTQTTVAHTLVIISTTPFLAALFGRVFLGELVPVRRYVAMSIALTGIVAMCLDSFTAGTLTGSIIAGGCAVAFAACVILLRHSQARADMTPAILVAALLSSAVALSFSLPFQAVWQDIGILACMGTLQGGLGCLLMTLAARYITAVEVSLLALLGNDPWAAVGVDRRGGTAQRSRHCWRRGGGCLVGAERIPGPVRTKPRSGSTAALGSIGRSTRVISFIIPAYNEQANIGRTLQALHQAVQPLDTAYEMLVVDDASTDRTASLAAAGGASVLSVRNRHIAATRNTGARAATGEYLFFIDADTWVNAAPSPRGRSRPPTGGGRGRQPVSL